MLTCSLKVRFESKIIPRSLTEDTGIKCCPRKGTLMSGTLLKSCFVPKRISLVLSGLVLSHGFVSFTVRYSLWNVAKCRGSWV